MPPGAPPHPVNPADLHIVHYPEAVLRRKAKRLEAVTDEVRAVAARMIELMYVEEGIGLAAPQVGLSWRLFVAHVPEDAEEPRSATMDPPMATLRPEVYINPVINVFEGPPEPLSEGCLSLPDIRGEVLRPPVISMSYVDEHGQAVTRRAGGLLARCWQHELDHLDGVLIIDKMTQMSRLKNRAAVRDLERGAER
jgi:peptide deformylase